MRRATPIVLVDDDPLYCEVAAADLGDHGFAVHVFCDGASLLTALEDGLDVELALLDWTLPSMSGLDLLHILRRRGFHLPVVFLTGRSPVEHELAALSSGAIDFVDKARGIGVLAPRLRVLVGAQDQRPGSVRTGALELKPGTGRAHWCGRDVNLTFTEYKVVTMLVAAAGGAVTYRALYDEVHYKNFVSGAGDRGYEVNVRGIVKRIRNKFRAVDPGFGAIANVPKAGYRWGRAAADDRGVVRRGLGVGAGRPG